MMSPRHDEPKHFADGDLLNSLYGLAPEDDTFAQHLSSCSECSRRWKTLRLARAATLTGAASTLIPQERLLQQRRALWARVDHPRKFWFSKLAPVAATAMLVFAGFVLLHPAPSLTGQGSQAEYRAKSSASASISDAELFGDLSAMASPAAPLAAEPIRGLFENSGSEQERSF